VLAGIVSEIIGLSVLDGFLVETVEAGSPAEKVGGDIMVAGNGRSFSEHKKFVEFVRGLKVGDEVRLTVFHEGETRQVGSPLPEPPK
jgi:S1-C subfamily serine protease